MSKLPGSILRPVLPRPLTLTYTRRRKRKRRRKGGEEEQEVDMGLYPYVPYVPPRTLDPGFGILHPPGGLTLPVGPHSPHKKIMKNRHHHHQASPPSRPPSSLVPHAGHNQLIIRSIQVGATRLFLSVGFSTFYYFI